MAAGVRVLLSFPREPRRLPTSHSTVSQRRSRPCRAPALRRATRRAASVVLLMVIVAACTDSDERPTPTSPRPTPTTADVPGESELLHTGWLDQANGWVLLSEPCGAGRCAAVVTSEDGGATFSDPVVLPARAHPWLPGLGARLDCSEHPCVAAVVIEDTQHGFAYGPDLLATADGGSTWTDEAIGPVLDMDTNGAVTVMVSLDCVDGEHTYRCPQAVRTKAVGAAEWTPMPFPASYGSSAQVSIDDEGQIVLLGSTEGGSPLLKRTTVGDTWSEVQASCQPWRIAESALAGDVAVLCVHARGARAADGADSSLWISTGGDTSMSDIPPPVEESQGGSSLAIGLTVIAVVVDDVVLMSTDEGASWTTAFAPVVEFVASGPEVLLPRDEGSWFLLFDGTLYGSTDDGGTWRPLLGGGLR